MTVSSDYFPPRDGFGPVVAQLEQDGVAIFPYINGRIFDINSTSYLPQARAELGCRRVTWRRTVDCTACSIRTARTLAATSI